VTDTAAQAVPDAGERVTASDWEDPPRHPDPDAAPVLSAAGFAGPLDWLVEMARARKIDLARLPIADLIASFVSALEAALARHNGGAAPPLARWGNWLVMAATLTWLRSCLLLPRTAPEAQQAETEAEALRRQLLDRAQIRAAADWLTTRPQLGRDVFSRGRPALHAPSRRGDLTELLRACLVALHVPEDQAAAARPPVPQLWQVTDAMRRLGVLLPVLPDGSALEKFLPPIDPRAANRSLRCRAAMATTLVAGLELARNEALTLEQGALWGEISVHRLAATIPADQTIAVSAG
jgi:segregation and condensation protein A